MLHQMQFLSIYLGISNYAIQIKKAIGEVFEYLLKAQTAKESGRRTIKYGNITRGLIFIFLISAERKEFTAEFFSSFESIIIWDKSYCFKILKNLGAKCAHPQIDPQNGKMTILTRKKVKIDEYPNSVIILYKMIILCTISNIVTNKKLQIGKLGVKRHFSPPMAQKLYKTNMTYNIYDWVSTIN